MRTDGDGPMTEGSGRTVRVASDIARLTEFLRSSQWTDGLPVVPPTVELVAEMVAASRRPGSDVVTPVPPSFADATIELIAANAVLAGCRPSAMPILMAALEAMMDPAFNLSGIQATTHPCGILLLVSGPAAARADIYGGEGCFGPGFTGNLTIGRAIRLVLMNIGGARPGTTDRSCQATPAKLGICFTENVSASPWAPFHVDQGWRAADSVVTVLAAEGPHNIQDHASTTAEGLLDTVAGAMRNVGANNFVMSLGAHRASSPGNWRPRPLVVFGPEHAQTIAGAGFDREGVRRLLWERSRVPFSQIPIDWRHDLNGTEEIPMTPEPEDILIAVAGGVGKHSCWMPSMGSTSMASQKIVEV